MKKKKIESYFYNYSIRHQVNKMSSSGTPIEAVKILIIEELRDYITHSDTIDIYDIKERDYENLLFEVGGDFAFYTLENRTPTLICFVEMLDNIYNGETIGDCYVWSHLCGNGLVQDGARALYYRVFKEYAKNYLSELGYTGFVNKMKEVNTEIMSLIHQR